MSNLPRFVHYAWSLLVSVACIPLVALSFVVYVSARVLYTVGLLVFLLAQALSLLTVTVYMLVVPRRVPGKRLCNPVVRFSLGISNAVNSVRF